MFNLFVLLIEAAKRLGHRPRNNLNIKDKSKRGIKLAIVARPFKP